MNDCGWSLADGTESGVKSGGDYIGINLDLIIIAEGFEELWASVGIALVDEDAVLILLGGGLEVGLWFGVLLH